MKNYADRGLECDKSKIFLTCNYNIRCTQVVDDLTLFFEVLLFIIYNWTYNIDLQCCS